LAQERLPSPPTSGLTRPPLDPTPVENATAADHSCWFSTETAPVVRSFVIAMRQNVDMAHGRRFNR
jgi:hypothetical protein